MSKTSTFTQPAMLQNRIDRFVHQRHTAQGYDRLREMARLDFSRQVAWEVSPGQRRQPSMPTLTFASQGFGVRKPCQDCLSPNDCARTAPSCYR